MISTLAYRSQLQSEKNAGLNRFSSTRGRVLTGFGGDLAGYNTNLIKSRAAQEDQLIQKKYERGEISFDELLAHLTKAANREWLSIEEKELLKTEVKDLKVKYEDEQVAKEYQSGRMKAADVANYQRSKLATMLPGNPVYENQLSEIAKWEKEDKVNKAKEYVAREEARIAGISDQTQAYGEQSNAYRQAANLFRQAGDTLTAYQYDEAANAADVNKQAYEVKTQKETTEQGKNDLVDRINLAYNQYHDGTIDAQTFLANLDSFEREAITGKYTDLLDNMNKLVDYVREDVAYGKDWSRGGMRIKGPGVGTGGGSYDMFTGEWTGGGDEVSAGGGTGYIGTTGSGISGVSGVKTTTSSVAKSAATPEENQTPEQQDTAFKQNFNDFNKFILDGVGPDGEPYTKDNYVTDIQSLITGRKDELLQRRSILESYGNKKVTYNGTKTSAKKIIESIDDELNNNWGKELGLSKEAVGSAGIVDMERELQGNPLEIAQGLDVYINQPKDVLGADYTPLLKSKTPLVEGTAPAGYVKDSMGRLFKMKSVAQDDILDLKAYTMLGSAQRSKYKYDPQMNSFIKKGAKTLYVDIPSSTGDVARYNVDENGKITGFTPTIKDQTKYSQYLPEGVKLEQFMATPSAITPISQMINTATTAAQLQKTKLAEEAARIANPEGQVLEPGQTQLNTIKNVISPVKQTTPMPVTAPKQFAEKFVNPLAPNKIIQPPKQTQTTVVPASFTGPLKTGTVSMADPLKDIKATQAALSYTPPKTTTSVTQPKPNIIQQGISWVSNLFKKKKQ